MKYFARFFELTETSDLHMVTQAHAYKAWMRKRRWGAAGENRTLRLVTMLCTEKLQPLRAFVMRLEIEDGWLTEKSINAALSAYFSLRPLLLEPPPTEYPLVAPQLEGWPDPDDLTRKMAVALDCPYDLMPLFMFGGPLLLGRFLGVGLNQALTYYDNEDTRDAAERVERGQPPSPPLE